MTLPREKAEGEEKRGMGTEQYGTFLFSSQGVTEESEEEELREDERPPRVQQHSGQRRGFFFLMFY